MEFMFHSHLIKEKNERRRATKEICFMTVSLKTKQKICQQREKKCNLKIYSAGSKAMQACTRCEEGKITCGRYKRREPCDATPHAHRWLLGDSASPTVLHIWPSRRPGTGR